MDLVPTFTTSNQRICLLLANGRMGFLRIEDAERLQVTNFSEPGLLLLHLSTLATAALVPAVLLLPGCLGCDGVSGGPA